MANRQSKRSATSRKARRSTKEDFNQFIDETNNIRKKEREESLVDIIKNININKNIKCKTLKQKELIKEIQNNQIIFVRGAAGTGKAQPLTEPILTPSGFVQIGSILPGDEVVSVDGTPAIVNSIHPQGIKDVYKISFSDGTHTLCCGEHLWETQVEKDRNNRKKINGVVTIAPKKGTVKTTLEIKESLFTDRGRKNHSIPICSPIEFSKKKLIINPYLMGCLIGDGCYSQNFVSFSSADEEIVCEFEQKLPNPVKISKKPGNNCDYYISTKTRSSKANNIVLFEMRELNLMGQKSHQKIIPDKYIYSSVDDRIELLRGLMDTDGHIPKNGSSIEYYTTSEALSNQVSDLVRGLGGISSIRTKLPFFKDKFGEKKQGKICYVVTVLFKTLNPFKLSRKAALFSDKKRMKIKYITSIEMHSKQECVCIHIDHPRHLYITRGYNVTHNTFIALKAALELLKKEDNPYHKILLTKPIIEAQENKLGFLPGGIDDKIDPYMDSYMTNIRLIVGGSQAKALNDAEAIDFNPLPYMRGATFMNSVAILDEAQNVTVGGMKLFISRKHESCKLIIMGDEDQTDLSIRGNDKNGLQDAFERFQNLEGVGFVTFSEDDIVRSSILIEIMKRYKNNSI